MKQPFSNTFAMQYIPLAMMFCFYCGNDSLAQNAPVPTQEEVRHFLIDTTMPPAISQKKMFALENKRNKVGLENLIGLSKEHAMAILSHYESRQLKEHSDYPFIKDVIEVKNFRRWDAPVTLYLFIDSLDVVCRMNYLLGAPKGISSDEAHAVLEGLAKGRNSLNYVPDSEWEIAGWNENERAYLYVWQKRVSPVQPSYLLTLKSYLDDHLIPFMKRHPLPNDGIFTPAPQVYSKTIG